MPSAAIKTTEKEIAIEDQPLMQSNVKRYFQLMLLVLAAGAIYPLLYLRQNFEVSILEVFQIASSDLSDYYSMLGMVLLLTYLPSGWLADRLSARLLMTFSLAGTGVIGLFFASIPDKAFLVYLFMAWGISAGLTFWASLIKGVNMAAGHNRQGMFFGILDGGRGLVEAILATIAIMVFAYAIETSNETSEMALKKVIYLYSFTCIVLAFVIFFLFEKKSKNNNNTQQTVKKSGSLWQDLKTLAVIPELWMASAIIFCGYQLYWATYSFSAFLQEGYEISAVTAGYITVAKLWMRPLGGIGAGLLGDKLGKENILSISMLVSTLALITIIAMPSALNISFLILCVLLIGLMTYAIRGIYWAILDDCHVPIHVTGLAVGVMSLLAYTPDVFLPQINNYIATRYEGVTVYQLYFGYIAVMGLLGFFATLKLKRMLAIKKE
jgi:MFS family permease